MKNEAYEWGYNYAAGQAAYENEQYMIVFGFIGIIIVIFMVGLFICGKIEEYKEKKRIEKQKERRKKRRVRNV